MKYLPSLFLSVLIFITCAARAWAQQAKCSLPTTQAPALQGLRLGMTAEELNARFKIIEAEPPDEFKVERMQLEPGRNQAEADSIRDLAVELMGHRVIAIRLVYNPSTTLETHQELAERLSRTLRLPAAWKPVSVGSMVTGMVLECAGFKVSANLIGGRIPVLYLSALEAETTLLRRQAERERRLRDFFKP